MAGSTTTMHHLALTAVDLVESGSFYDAVLGELGYARSHTSDKLCVWHGPTPEILLYAAEGDDRSHHRHGRPGWQHAAFAVSDRQTVLAVHKAVEAGGWTTVHPPREYPDYSDGYFAVFVEDPAGLRIEVAHIPSPTS
jgi:catechol 2,3-dioxygenase-like lactoylglutathione lyase family enzyme